jgi:hypothetical protein
MMPSSLRLKQKPSIENIQPMENVQKEVPQVIEKKPVTMELKQPENITKKTENLPSTLKPKQSNFPFEGENDLEREIERNQAQLTSRIGETVLGLPGDLYSFAKGIFGFDSETNLPTSKSLREGSEKASLGYTKPKNEFEEKSGEVMQDIASFMIPGSRQYSMLRNIGIPLAANAAKEGLKLSGNEKNSDMAKLGLMVGLDLISQRKGGAKKYAGELFNQSEKIVPKGAMLKSTAFEKSLDKLDKTLSSGGSAPSTEKALRKVNEIQSKIKNGEIEIKELIDFRKNINEIISETGGFEVQLPKAIKRKAIANLGDVKKEVINGLNEYGQKHNPEFLKLNKSANEAYAAYESSNKIANFIGKSIKGTLKTPAIKALFGIGTGMGAYTYPTILAKTAVAGVPALAGYEAYKILHQVYQSPTLRKYYGEVLKGAIIGNTSQVSRNLKALDQGLSESP